MEREKQENAEGQINGRNGTGNNRSHGNAKLGQADGICHPVIS